MCFDGSSGVTGRSLFRRVLGGHREESVLTSLRWSQDGVCLDGFPMVTAKSLFRRVLGDHREESV